MLKYRLVKDGYDVPTILEDAARAVRLIRTNAAKWQLDPHRIGIIGSSAGGHLVATLITRVDSGHSTRPIRSNTPVAPTWECSATRLSCRPR